MELELACLSRFRSALAEADEVVVSIDRQGQVLLLVGGSLLLVSWPWVAGQAERGAAGRGARAFGVNDPQVGHTGGLR